MWRIEHPTCSLYWLSSSRHHTDNFCASWLRWHHSQYSSPVLSIFIGAYANALLSFSRLTAIFKVKSLQLDLLRARCISSPCLAIYGSFMEMLIAYCAKCVLIARINGMLWGRDWFTGHFGACLMIYHQLKKYKWWQLIEKFNLTHN